jgi:hypothetical protein
MAFVATSWPLFDGVADAFDDYAHELGEILEKGIPGQAGNECPNKELRKVQRRMIKAWSWLFDGAFHKRDTSLNFEVPITNESEIVIEELSVCPLRFVKEEVKALLQERGETFWKCRFRRFVSYSGDDVDDSHNAVSASSTCSPFLTSCGKEERVLTMIIGTTGRRPVYD